MEIVAWFVHYTALRTQPKGIKMIDSNCSGIPVLIGPAGNSAQRLERVPLVHTGEFDEAFLQRLVHEHPLCLPLSEIEPGLDSFVSICREMPTPRGCVDNLLMTARGDIAFVETKLFRNPQARREVLAQALDYATSLFEMTYDEFERAALRGVFSPLQKPKSLYAALTSALPEPEKPNESAFIDAVTLHLRKGRVLIIIAGEGIRGEIEKLLEGLEAHARFGFTVALVELSVFRMPDSPNKFLVRPRTLVKTSIVRRTVVEVDQFGQATVSDKNLIAPETQSTDSYWQAIEQKIPGSRAELEQFFEEVDSLGVFPDFLKSLIFRWTRPGLQSLNLGYIDKLGRVWTDLRPGEADHQAYQTYVREIAEAFHCDAHKIGTGGSLTPYKDGKPLRISSMMPRLAAWKEPMQHFIENLRKRDAATG